MLICFNSQSQIINKYRLTTPALFITLSQDLVVRLLFTLGNLTAKSDEARLQLFQCDSCMETLLQLYNSYQHRVESPHAPLQKGPPSPSKPPAPPVSVQEDEDVLVKLVRVLANMCIHPAVGPALTTNTACIQLLMETLGEQRAGRAHSLKVSQKLTRSVTSLKVKDAADLQLQNFQMCPFGPYICHTKEAVC